jgi:hypothetical protein
MNDTAVPTDDEPDSLSRLRALLAVGLEQSERGEVIELTPEYLEDLDRRVEEAFLRGEEPRPEVCP